MHARQKSHDVLRVYVDRSLRIFEVYAPRIAPWALGHREQTYPKPRCHNG